MTSENEQLKVEPNAEVGLYMYSKTRYLGSEKLKLHGKAIAALEVPTSVNLNRKLVAQVAAEQRLHYWRQYRLRFVGRDWTSNCGLENVEAEGGMSSKLPYKDYSRIYCLHECWKQLDCMQGGWQLYLVMAVS